MLDPDIRSTLTEALQPPDGFVFDQALAATYSLDLTTLLAVPLHLSLFASGDTKSLLENQIALLEALRRTVSRMGIYCQQGQIHIPNLPHVLYGLLEPGVVGVRSPRGGSFHPKFWILRFSDPAGKNPAWLRLIVLSRNLTADRSWDVALTVEGQPGERDLRANRELAQLIRLLPQFAAKPPSAQLSNQASLLADEISRVDWTLPEGFESLRFHVMGLGKKKWMPPQSRRLVVISPFCAATAVKALAQTTGEPVALISRAEELDKLDHSTLQLFARLFVLNEAAETEDGEDTSEGDEGGPAQRESGALRGLHAKAYMAENGWNTHILLGSANATGSALLSGSNVEVMAELVGRRSRVGGISELLEEGGFRDVLDEYHPTAQKAVDEAMERAEKAIERGRKEICDAGLHLVCTGSGDAWQLSIIPERAVRLEGIQSVRTWLISMNEEQAIDASCLSKKSALVLPECALASVTTFVAFELVAEAADLSARFVLNLPAEGLPADRKGAIIRTIIRNRDGFLRYLMLLLADTTAQAALADLLGQTSGDGGGGPFVFRSDFPLLEELTRTLSRDPGRLLEIKALVEDLNVGQAGKDIVPEEFLALWRVFEEAMPEVGD
jgi:hypothetical protein